jgi:hypothetical protein
VIIWSGSPPHCVPRLPQGAGDRAPEVINVVTEVLSSSDFSLDSYTDAAMGQVESFENFQLIFHNAWRITCSYDVSRYGL